MGFFSLARFAQLQLSSTSRLPPSHPPPLAQVKKVARETLGCERLELFSFHSTSKGLIGECGRRGGYMEVR